MSKSTVRPMPSPNNTNREGLFLRQTIVTRKQLLAMDADPAMAEELETSERNGVFDPRDHTAGETEGGRERASEDRRRARGRDTDPPIVRPSPEQNRGPGTAEDDERDAHEDFVVDFLRERGFGEDAIKTAVDDYHKAKGRDRLPERVNVRDDGKDRIPLRGGKFGRPRFGRDNEAENPNMRIVDHGLDAEESFEKRWPEVARVERDYEARDLSRDSRRRHAMDSKAVVMTEARKRGFFQRYPGAERLDA